MNYLRWPREPIEGHIDIREFKGWRGKHWQQTKENAAKAANYLLGAEPSAEHITAQLSNAIGRIHAYQAASILVLLADLAAPLFLGQAGYNIREPADRLAAYALIVPPGLIAIINVIRLDQRKYFYREIINSLRNRAAGRQGTQGLEESLSRTTS